MPYFPSKPLSSELGIATPHALCLEFGGSSNRCLAVLKEMGVESLLLLERAPSITDADQAPTSVPILAHSGSQTAAGASRYMAQ